MKTKVLVVGAGAVGQVYGHHLQRGGAEVSVLVRGHHLASARGGYAVTHIWSRRSRETTRWNPHEILTDVGAIRSRRYHQVWICVPNTSLDEDWFRSIAEASGEATLVVMVPGSNVRELCERAARADRLVFGVVAMASFKAPMEGSDAIYEIETPKSIAYFFPPIQSSKMSGAPDRRDAVIGALRRGGCPSGIVADASRTSGFSTALLMPTIGALESVGWSLARFAEGEAKTLGVRAGQEALVIFSKKLGVEPPFVPTLLRPWMIGFALGSVAPRVAAFDIEGFLRVHFSKVGAQTRAILREYIALGQRYELPHAALEELLGELTSVDG